MAERLVKIAKELNVGLSTIVDFLASKGHVIENKPTSMVSEEMHSALLKEFRSSMAEKEKAKFSEFWKENAEYESIAIVGAMCNVGERMYGRSA